MRIFLGIFLGLATICMAVAPVFAQSYNQVQGQLRPYPGGNIAYYNPGQVYPPPGVASPGYALGPSHPNYQVGGGAYQPKVLPPAQGVSAGTYRPGAQAPPPPVSNYNMYAPDTSSAAYPAEGPIPYGDAFRPGVSLSAPNPHTNYVGDSEWEHFAQRTASFEPEPVVKPKPKPRPKPKSKAKPKPKATAKPKAKPEAKPEPVADIPKRPMNDKELETFCLEYAELCTDYIK